MSKQEVFQSMWIPVSAERLPPDNQHEVLLYNSKEGLIFTYPGHVARKMFDKNVWNAEARHRAGGLEFKPCDITHWMPVFPPEGGITSCERYLDELPF